MSTTPGCTRACRLGPRRGAACRARPGDRAPTHCRRRAATAPAAWLGLQVGCGPVEGGKASRRSGRHGLCKDPQSWAIRLGGGGGGCGCPDLAQGCCGSTPRLRQLASMTCTSPAAGRVAEQAGACLLPPAPTRLRPPPPALGPGAWSPRCHSCPFSREAAGQRPSRLSRPPLPPSSGSSRCGAAGCLEMPLRVSEIQFQKSSAVGAGCWTSAARTPSIPVLGRCAARHA